MVLELLDDAPLLELVDLDDGGEKLEVVAGVGGELLQRRGVLREARAAVTDAGPQEVRPEATVEADPARDLLDVGPDKLADVGDLVDEADPRHERGVGRELDHLRGGDVGAHDRRVERLVQRGDAVGVGLGEAADHDAVGSLKFASAVPSARNSGFDT